MAPDSPRSRVFLDVSIDGEPAGRLPIELFADEAPKASENFRALCVGYKSTLTYRSTPFYRLIDGVLIEGGDVTNGDGTGGESIYGGTFEDENLRNIDAAGLVCMANAGKNTNTSRFFISLAPLPNLSGKHTVLGALCGGHHLLARLSRLPTDSHDRPTSRALVAHSGELERRQPAQHHEPDRRRGRGYTGASSRRSTTQSPSPTPSPSPSPSRSPSRPASRGRRKRRRSASSMSPSRSPSPSRGHTRPSASRLRHQHRHRRQRGSGDSGGRATSRSSRTRSPTGSPAPGPRRRSDAVPDHTLRGRGRERSQGRDAAGAGKGDAAAAAGPASGAAAVASPQAPRRRRSPPPSRSRSRSRSDGEGSPRFRRRRSLPNQYRRYERMQQQRRLDRWTGGGGGARAGEDGRLGGFEEDWAGGDDGAGDGIVYKGRGAMKYKEKRRG